MKALEGLVEHATLERSSGRVVDAVLPPEAIEIATPLRAERFIDGAAIEIGDRLDRDVNRVEAERRARSVRARLARCQLVRRQDLQNAMTGSANPGGAPGEIANLADAPVFSRANREQRKNDAGDA